MDESCTVSVCICTYRRPQQLAWLLDDLIAQTRRPDEVVVVDNEVGGSGRATVEAARERAPFPIRYDIQPVKNISLTRNLTVANAHGDWLGFLDDDERIQADWLALMLDTARQCSADGVMAPVNAIVPTTAPDWIKRGNLYLSAPRPPSGQLMPRTWQGIGNALLRASRVRALQGPFDPDFGLTGGEDGDMLSRLVQSGAKIVFCNEAAATEPVADNRLNLYWILLRAIRGNQDYANHWRNGRFGILRPWTMPLFYLRAAALMLMAALLVLPCLLLGRHRAAHWLRLSAGNFGKLSTLWGWHYQEYAVPKSSTPGYPGSGAESRHLYALPARSLLLARVG